VASRARPRVRDAFTPARPNREVQVLQLPDPDDPALAWLESDGQRSSALDDAKWHEPGDAAGEAGLLDGGDHGVDVLVGERRLLGQPPA